ncbi:MAG: di-trans,poly-cis-decaprenylcistransferase [Bdellovibrionales bacterium]|nr:di-trans,poly-cis-decaprenylcistransferase [Bdellovibrionales bacterium]
MTLAVRGPAIPSHVAIIMDGNGRWAQKRGHPRAFGHIRGASRIKPIVEHAQRLGIRALTLYAFSTENWNRPQAELDALWKILKKFLAKEEAHLAKNNVRLRVIGEIERLGSDVRQVLDPVLERLGHNTGLQLTFAVSYGSQREIVRAARHFAMDCVGGKRNPNELDEGLFGRYLWTGDLGELSQVDLVIRTSGEIRISNFLLWQAAYAEFYFTDTCWPDFGPEDLDLAVASFQRRDRRFGGIGKVLKNDRSALDKRT